ncbi:PQQ-binding-like beta-propeller repeat protein [Nocardioides anomalus]|uniref:PQQ-binding-like beta-propeller repeat protein n=1 Tax=Nocardioides anomalus TaxID=2712223 RepID=A0A6G6WGS7_9ACTN|nr:PQQ-binding-like beta-propeller repeat protein [Nocardioides anomalus]QIG44363.1 PQQ-binding-like beta-propeller repeat protein [Nocardioides anomalus]
MRALPGVTVTAAGALVVGLLWWGTADQVSGDPENAATALVPPDGTRGLVTSDGTADGSAQVVEHARLTGPEMVVTSPVVVGGAIATVLDDDPYSWRIWRSTTTTYPQDEEEEQTQQETTLRRLTDDGVEQLAAYGPIALVFDPPLLEVPADVADGSEWSGDGDLIVDGETGQLGYRGSFAAQADGDDCLRITGSLSFVRGEDTVLDNPTDERWCRGRGIVAEQDVDAPALAGSTEPLEPDLGGVEDWAAHDRPLRVAGGGEGVEDTPASITLDEAPVAGVDGRLLLPDAQADDVVAFDPVGDGTRLRTWVAHPGGEVLSLEAAGDVVVAGTSRRQVVAYGPRGDWRWSHGLDDVPSGQPLAVDADHLVVTSAAGEVDALDPVSGQLLWTGALSDRIRLQPVHGSRTVVVSDVAGRLTAYDTDDGTEAWSTEVTGGVESMAVVDSVLVVRAPDAVQAFDVADGERLWSSRISPTSTGSTVAALGAVVALTSSEGTVALGVRDGRERWRSDGGDEALAVGGHLFVLDGRRLVAFGADGEVRGWTLSGLRGTTLYLSATSDGVLVADGTGASVEVGP